MAELLVPATLVIRVPLTELQGAGHVDVWADPEDLLAAVVNVARLERRA